MERRRAADIFRPGPGCLSDIYTSATGDGRVASGGRGKLIQEWR